MPIKCPHCDQMILSAEVQDIDLSVGFRPQWKGFAYTCPRCQKVLSVEMNPLTLQTDTVSRVAQIVAQQLNQLLAQIVDLFRRP
jgi:transcription elongation factor Elf1